MNRLKTGVLSNSYTGTGSGFSDMHSMGYFETSAALIAAHPVGEAGDWAIVGATDTVWVWDLATSGWKDTGQGAIVAWGGITGFLADQLDLKGALDGKQNSLGFTPENVANKVTAFQETPEDTKYPSEKLVKVELDKKADREGVDTQFMIEAQDDTDTGDNLQANGLVLDGAVDTDKQIIFADNGAPKWAVQGSWRNEQGEFFYLYNLTSGENILVASQGGRFSYNKPTNLIMEHAAFVGAGLNDMLPSGLYTQRITRGFNIEIDGTGTPDTFRWSAGTASGGFVVQAANVPITAGKIALNWGIEIEFGATTGHTLADKWAFRAHPQDALDSLTLKPPMIHHVYEYNGTGFTDYTYQASTTHCSIGSTFPALSTVNHVLYLGNKSKFNSGYCLFDQFGAGLTLVVEYWNGAAWVALTATEGLIDSTSNFTADGSLSWDKSTFQAWAAAAVNGVTAYWIRVRSSTGPTIVPSLKSISRHTDYRLAVYSAHNDTVRAFAVKGNGITEMYKADRASTSEGFRSSEFVTEARLRRALSIYTSETSYFATGEVFAAALPAVAFSKAITVTTDGPNTIGTWLEPDAHGTDVEAGDKFEVYCYLQKSTTNRAASYYAELWRYSAAGAELTKVATSNTLTATPNTTGIEAYEFIIIAAAGQVMDPTDRLAVRIIAQRASNHTQVFTLWGGSSAYPSTLDYDGETVTLDRLFDHFEEDVSGIKSQWKAKGSGADLDVELVPKGAGISRSSGDFTAAGNIDGANMKNEILPIDIFEDGAVPPAELNIIDGKRYRDFTVNDDADLYVLKRANYNNPNSVRLVMVISNATAPAAGETIDFEVSINGGAAVTLSYTGLGTEAQNDVVVTDFESVSFGAGNYTVSLERVAGAYAQEIGVMAVEVN